MEPDAPRRKSSPAAVFAWIVIGVLLVLIAAWTVWAASRPEIRSMWAPD
jgi:hypothetical protein